MTSTLATRALATTLALATLAALARASDWPQYNGAQHDRRSAERIGLRRWPNDGPPRLWKVPTATGFSSFAVADGKAFTLVRREVDGQRREVCVALDATTGGERWSTALGAGSYDGGADSGAKGNDGGDGPRGTPSFADGRVYVFDAHLVLSCLDAKDGAVVWRKDLVAEHGARELHWQNAACALVDGERVFAAGGGPGQSLLAFDRRTGEVAWKRGDERATHATPIAATIHGVRQVIFFVQAGLVAVEPATGAELWRAEYPYRTSTAASPVVHGDIVYCSAGYGVGGGAFRIVAQKDGFAATLLWQKRNKLMNHWSTPVCKDGYLYGLFSFKDYGDGPLECVELATGETRWSQAGFGPGNCILVGDDLLVLSDAGAVVLVEPQPGAYRELARTEALEGKCWSTPSFSDGRLYVRSTTEGACLDLSGERAL